MIGPSSHVSKILLALFFLLLFYFVFMDVSMYLRIQNYPIGSNDVLPSQPQLYYQESNSTLFLLNATRKEYTSEQYKSVNLTHKRSIRESQVEYESVTWISCNINPLCYPTVKALMLDHTNHYLFAPLVSILDDAIGISEDMLFITPNMISYSHVFLAMIAGKLISMDNLAYRRVGVLIFQIRTFLDDVDGHVARARKHIHGERSEVGTSGYYIDGICDLLGCIFLIIGVLFYLKNNPPRRGYVKMHTLLPQYNENQSVKETSDSNGDVGFIYKPKVSTEKMVRKILMFSGQLALSSFAWNRYIDIYQATLEKDDISVNSAQKQRQSFVFRSRLFFAVSWLWKIVNVHNLMHFILFAIFCDKLWEFLRFVQFAGYALLVASVCFTEMHVIKVQNYVFKTLSYNSGAQL